MTFVELVIVAAPNTVKTGQGDVTDNPAVVNETEIRFAPGDAPGVIVIFKIFDVAPKSESFASVPHTMALHHVALEMKLEPLKVTVLLM